MKYVNGKLRVGFQQRSSDNTDRYTYQNGVYYAYSDQAEGFGEWKNHKGEPMTWPLVNSDEIKVFEPGDYISHQEANSVYIVGSFDWTVTAKGDIHIISLVRSTDRNRPDFEQVYIHSYKPAGADEFIHSTDFVGASNIYTSGDNVYIIGLRNGYPYVEKAVGGTNDFERVYEQTEGTQFDHGTVYIKDGKVYYYLMERFANGITTSQPLHLQIIDLDLAADATRPSVSFTQSAMTVDEGYDKLSLTINATSPVEDRTIESVTLYLNGELVRTDDSVPYLFGHGSKPHETGAMGWLETHTPNPNPLGAGVHTFKAVAIDSEGQSSEAYMQLTVKSNAPLVSFASSEMTLDYGFEKLALGIEASSPDENRTIESVTLYLNDELVRVDNSVPYLFGHGSKPHETGAMGWLESHTPNPNPLAPGVHTFKAVVLDSEGEKSEAEMTLTVNGLPQPPTVSFPKSVIEVYEGYEKLGMTLTAESPVEGRSVVSVTLYRNDELVRVDTRPVWNFGHSHAPYEFGAMGWLDTHEPNPSPLGVGEHTFKAVAEDSEGLTGEDFMTLIVNEVPVPSVNFSESEIELSVSYESLSVSVSASSIVSWVGIERIDLYLDGELVRDIYDAPYTWGGEYYPEELLGAAAGEHTLKAIATDTNGKTAEAQMTFTVKPAVISVDSEAEGFAALNIFDGDISDASSWSANQNGTKNVIVDLGEIKTILGTKLWTTLGEEVKYQVYIADNLNDEFVKVAKHQNKHDNTQPTMTDFYAQGRYVKLMAIGDWPNINEFEVIFE